MSRYLNLVGEFVKRDLKKQYSGSILGVAWVFLNPFFQIAIYTTIFGSFFKSRPFVHQTEVPYILFLCTALIPWNLFNGTIMRCVSSFHEHAEYLKKLDLAKHLFLVYPMVSSLVPFAMLFVMLLVLFFAFGSPVSTLGILVYLFAYFLLMLFLFGLALALSPINIFIRDVSHFLPYVLQALFWATPITYDISVLPPWALEVLKFNPLYYFIDAFRTSMLGNPVVALTHHIPYCVGLASVSCIVGFYVYKSLSDWVTDEL